MHITSVPMQLILDIPHFGIQQLDLFNIFTPPSSKVVELLSQTPQTQLERMKYDVRTEYSRLRAAHPSRAKKLNSSEKWEFLQLDALIKHSEYSINPAPITRWKANAMVAAYRKVYRPDGSVRDN